jgi:hypothetical protein
MTATLRSGNKIVSRKGVTMRTFRYLAVVSMSLILLLSACGGQQENHEDMVTPVETTEVTYEPGAWMNMTLTDARTGVAFKLSDFSDKVIILEMMDPGCYICKDQLKEVKAALEAVGDKAVAVSVDVGFKGDAAVAKWADQNGGTWLVSSMPREFGQALVSDFGSLITVPSGTPVVIIYPSGEKHATEPGIKTSATLIELVNQWNQ